MKKFQLIFSAFLVLSLTINNGSAQTFNTIIGEENNDPNAGESIISADKNVLIGDSTGVSLNSGLNNIFVGYRAGYSSRSASTNTFIGSEAGFSTETGGDNVFVGYNAGNLTTTTDNTFVGARSGQNNTRGCDNTFIGESTGIENTTGDDNVFIGNRAGLNNTVASGNTFIGKNAGQENTEGEGNTFVGGEATFNTSYSSEYIYFYSGAGVRNTTGDANTFIGAGAGTDSQIGSANTFVGHGTGSHTEFSDESTFIGAFAGWDNNRTRGTANALRNNYFGFATGGTNREGSDNVGIGHDADFEDDASGRNNAINMRNVFIGNSTSLDRSNDVVLVGYNGTVRNAANQSIGVGSEAYIAGENSIGIGYSTNIASAADNAIGIGHEVDVDGLQATAIGSNANVSGTNSTAIGYQASVEVNNEIYLGNSAITAIGGVVNWTATSDGRFKTDVLEDVIGLAFINHLRPVTYRYDAEKLHTLQGCDIESLEQALLEKTQIRYSGFIAQEVAAAAEQLGYDFSGVDAPQNEEDIYGLRYAEFVVPLVKAVQELSAENEAKDKLIAQQQKELVAYQKMLGDLTARVEALERTTDDAPPLSLTTNN